MSKDKALTTLQVCSMRLRLKISGRLVRNTALRHALNGVFGNFSFCLVVERLCRILSEYTAL